MDEVNVSLQIPFCFKTSQAHEYHFPSHPVTHSPSFTSCRISSRVFFDLSSFCCAFLISHAVFRISATTRGPLLTINSAMSDLPSNFYMFAKASNSVLVLMPFSTIISESSKGVSRFFRFFRLVLSSTSEAVVSTSKQSSSKSSPETVDCVEIAMSPSIRTFLRSLQAVFVLGAFEFHKSG